MPRLKTFITAFYAYAFLFEFMLCYAIYTAYFEFQGLSYFEIGMLLAFWSGSALALEIATGALSDWLDRRWLMMAAPFFKLFTFIAWALADGNFWIYGLGFLMWSLGQSLYSGTAEALLYERLEAEGEEDKFDRYYGRVTAVDNLATGLGMFFGGFVAAQNMELSIWLSIPPLIVASGVAMFLVDVRRSKKREDTENEQASPEAGFWLQFQQAAQDLLANPPLRFSLLYIAVGLVLFAELEEFDLLFYAAVDLPIVWFGIVGGVALGLQSLASAQAYRFKQFDWMAWALPLGAGLTIFAAAMFDQVWSVAVLEVGYVLSVPAAVLAEARFQSTMAGKSRATVTSMLYFAQNVTALLLALAFGWLAQNFGLLPGYAWAGMVMVPVAVWTYWQQRRGHSAF